MGVIVSAAKLFIISACSGAGKTTLVNAALHNIRRIYQVSIERVVTYTTKAPRQDEIPGQSYYFLSEAEFQSKIRANFFLEWSEAYGHYYGSPRSVLEQVAAGISQVLIVDLVGVQTLRCQHLPLAIFVWIAVDPKILYQRLIIRSTNSQAEIERRMSLARQEIKQKQVSSFDFEINNNGLLSRGMNDLELLFVQQLKLA